MPQETFVQEGGGRRGAAAPGGGKNCALHSHVGVVAPAAAGASPVLTARASARFVVVACRNTVFDIPAMMFRPAGGRRGKRQPARRKKSNISIE
jgi:hypothetical protein